MDYNSLLSLDKSGCFSSLSYNIHMSICAFEELQVSVIIPPLPS